MATARARTIAITDEIWEQIRHWHGGEPMPREIMELRDEIAREIRNAEDLAILFGCVDESAVRSIVVLKIKLDDLYTDHLTKRTLH